MGCWTADTIELKPDALSVLIGINDEGHSVPIVSALDQVLIHRHAGFASSSFRATITRGSLTSTGILLLIFMISGLFSGLIIYRGLKPH